MKTTEPDPEPDRIRAQPETWDVVKMQMIR